jgi:hypothetical protein
MTFSLTGEGGVGYTTDTIRSTGFEQTRHENQNLVRYLAAVNFLSEKPYNASFYAAQDHTYQNYDFFNTATVDSTRYGGRIGWSSKSWTVNVDTGYREENTEGFTGSSDIADTFLHFSGVNQRDGRGSTSVSYNFDEYSNTLNFGPPQTSTTQAIGVSDSESFGSHRQITAVTGLNFSHYSYFNAAIDTYEASENITVNHTPNLDSLYSFTGDRTEQGDASSSLFVGLASLRHRLYESLVSTVDAHGTYDESSSPSGSANNDRYGLGLHEDYTKRLGDWGRLNLGAGVIADHEDHDATGTILTVLDERHTLFLTTSPSFRPAFLNNPRVILSTVDVRNAQGIPAQQNVDYQLIPSGELTEIRLIQGSTILRDGATALVSYQSESLFKSSFEALNASAQIRLDLYNTFGVYGRVGWLGNNAPPEALVETLTDLVGGVDATWRFLRAGAEYEDFDSSFTKYRAFRLFQTFTFHPGDASTLGLDFNQIFYRYPDGRSDTQYQFLSHMDTQLATWLWWNVEAGYFLQDAFGTEQNLTAARTGLSAMWGKLSLRTGYQYNYQLTTQEFASERRDRNFFYVHLRRVF